MSAAATAFVPAGTPIASGQPLRALSVAGLGLALWLAVRLPILEQDFAAARAQLAPPVPALATTGAVGIEPIPPLALEVLPPPPAEPVLQDLAMAAAGWSERASTGPAFWPDVPVPGAMRQPTTEMLPPGFELPLPNRPLASAAPPPAGAQAPAAVPRASPGSGDFAAAAYARLAEGDRRGAARLFDLALASDDGDARRAQWIADRRTLTRRWSAQAFTLLRDPGSGGVGPAASPVLGGGQSGAIVAFAINPLARRPVSLVARLTAATGNGGQLDNASSQAAFGARWQMLPGVSLSAERLVAIGAAVRSDWTLRLAAGADSRRGRLHWSAYGEAGVLGNGDGYGGAQARAMLEIVQLGRARFELGPGAWGSVQTGPVTVGRLDIGPSISTQLPFGRASLEISADWRQRVAGQALPDSGPVLTLSTQF
jgi:hypothetical protein